MQRTINIIARTNGVGLDRDVDLLHSILSTAGYDVTISHCRSISPMRSLFPGSPRYDANIFIERIFARWLHTAKSNLLIPNQERFPHRHIKFLNKIDHILCKSQHAKQIFSQLGHTTHFTGFTSSDLFDESIQPDYQSFLHLAGRSTLKGTETILDLWKKHPEWPTLTLLQCKENAPDNVPANIQLISEYIQHKDIRKKLNTHGIHLCTSLSEGWGHYIAEAMSCRALVVTTDAPPMNELVTPARGVTIPYHQSEPRHLGMNFHVDPYKLEQNIQQLLSMSEDKKTAIGNNARTWFKENENIFRRKFTQTLEKILKS